MLTNDRNRVNILPRFRLTVSCLNDIKAKKTKACNTFPDANCGYCRRKRVIILPFHTKCGILVRLTYNHDTVIRFIPWLLATVYQGKSNLRLVRKDGCLTNKPTKNSRVFFQILKDKDSYISTVMEGRRVRQGDRRWKAHQ
jgi:hypothetical protein